MQGEVVDDLAVGPDALDVIAGCTSLRMGSLLFLPAYWWHEETAIRPSISNRLACTKSRTMVCESSASFPMSVSTTIRER